MLKSLRNDIIFFKLLVDKIRKTDNMTKIINKFKEWLKEQWRIINTPTSGELYRQFLKEFELEVDNMENKTNKKIAIDLELLETIRHEFVSLTGLTAFDKCASQLGYVEVFDEDRIELDYNELISKIDNVLDEK